MPRYFFHVRDGQEYLDADGSELENFAAAQLYSLQIMTQLLSTVDYALWNGQEWRLHVEDEAGKELFLLKFMAVMKPPA